MRSCPFCSNPADSAEHLYPQWLSEHFTRRSPRGTFTLNMPPHLGGPREVRTLNQTFKVCARCNNGWMSQLEYEAKPIILALMQDEAVSLSPEEQALLARWLFKTAVMHEYTQQDAHVSTASTRALLAAGEVPSGWSAHLARAEPPHAWMGYQRMGPLVTYSHDDGTFRGRMRLHTLQIRYMVTQVLVHSLEVDPVVAPLLGGSRFSLPLWPPQNRSVPWPPASESLFPEWIEIVSGLNDPAEEDA